jgi:hypothetical protein
MLPCNWQLVLLLAVLCVGTKASSTPGSTLMDSTGRLQSIPNIPTTNGIVAIIASPGTPSALLTDEPHDILSLASSASASSSTASLIVCRGATLRGTSDQERNALATCSLIAGAVVVDGVTVGDVQAGLRNSRHARTLTALFRARVKLSSRDDDDKNNDSSNTVAPVPKQTLLLVINGDQAEIDHDQLQNEIKSLYKAAAVEKKGAASLEEVYDLQVVAVNSDDDATQILSLASEAATAAVQSGHDSLADTLAASLSQVRESGVGAVALDPPHVAHAFVAVGQSYGKQARAARAKIVSWKARTARGLLVDAFGREAALLRNRVLGTFEKETLSAAGLPLVANYRLEQRTRLKALLDTAVEEVFAAQVHNLEQSTLKRFNAGLLRTMNDPVESVMDSNAAALRKETFTFETLMDDLEVPGLGLTKVKAARELTAKLNDALVAFPDSPAAKIKRTGRVNKVVNKEKKPGQRGVDFGVDLVAVLRPDGFGSLQGFAGYQMGGNSLTFGVHNDADDPQTIAQFGGVRPPLLRVQPKLRVDVEL